MKKISLVTGITGQDGAYLAKFLLRKDYNVYGVYRRTSSVNFWRIAELGIQNNSNLHLVEADLTVLILILSLIKKINPDEIYNLAAQSFVGLSFEQPSLTSQVNSLGVVNILEAIRILGKSIRFYQASTSEMFGLVQSIPQNERTAFYPRSPYAISKLYSHWMTINYRESYNIFAVSGILFNHESPLRGIEFVTRKITDGVAKIKLGKLDLIELGNLDSKRDWGYAEDFVEGMWLMTQAKIPETYVLATSRTETIRTFVVMAFMSAGIKIKFEGSGDEEIGLNADTGKTILRINPKFYRPAEVDLLKGDASKAKKDLSWAPKTSLEDLAEMMVKADLRRNE
mgnify:CR=1 FL=1